MKTPRKLLCPLAGIVMLVAWIGFGCEKTTNGPQPIPGNCDTAAVIVIEANDSLGRQMLTVIEETLDDPDSTFRPREIDFSGVNSMYEKALAYCPSDLDAKFGSAFTGLMTFLTDPEFNSLIDRFKYVFDTSTFEPFKTARLLPEVCLGRALSPDGIPLQPKRFQDVLPALISLDHAIVLSAAGDPMISNIQHNLEDRLLPRVVNSRNKLIDVLGNPAFTFTITPLMQGNAGANPIVLDRSDFRVILATLYAAEASLHIFFARDLDLSSYSVAAVEEAVDRNSSFLSLKGNNAGATHMADAKARILSAEAELEKAVEHLMAEVGTDQDDDLIKVYPEDMEDLQMLRDSLRYYRTYFDGPKELEVIWTDHWECGYDEYWNWHCDEVLDTVTMMVDISRFFDDPMHNPKQFLPVYTITMEQLDDDQIVVCYEWQASTYASWTWPFPTFNGLLPGMTSDELKELMLDDGSDWRQSDCDTTYIDID